MLFSATMPAWVKKLSQQYLRDPEVIDLVGTNDDKAADTIKFPSLLVCLFVSWLAGWWVVGEAHH